MTRTPANALAFTLGALSLLGGCKSDKEKGAPGAEAGQSAPAEPGKMDGCALLSQADATALFGKPATRKTGAYTPDPALVADCEWGHSEPDNSSQLLQLQVWGKESYYSQTPDEQPYALGQKGNIKVGDLTGIDIMWVDKGKTIMFSHSSIGPSVPAAKSKLEQVEALAKKIDAAL